MKHLGPKVCPPLGVGRRAFTCLTGLVLTTLGFVSPASAQNEFELRVINANGSFESPDAQTLIIESIDSGTFELDVFLDNNDDPIESWAYGVCHDENLFTITDAIDRAETLEIGFLFPPAFTTLSVFPDGFIQATVISLTDTFQLPLNADVVVATASYELDDVSGIMDGTSSIEICDTLNSPPTISLITPDNQVPVPPATLPVDITLSEVLFGVVITECTATAEDITLSWTDEDPMDGFQRFAFYALAKDGQFLGIFDPEVETGLGPAEDGVITFVDTDVTPGQTVFYNVVGVAFPDPMGPSVVAEATCSATVIALELFDAQPSNGFFFGGDEVTLTGSGFLSAPDLEVTIGSNPPFLATVVDDTTATFVTPDNMDVGVVDISAANIFTTDTLLQAYTYGFVRGDFDCNNEIELSDAIDLLTFLFSQGAPPCCFDGADTTDNGTLSIDDVIQILNFLFSGVLNIQSPFPAMPTSTMLDRIDAGLDPTDDDPLGCAQ